MQDRIITHKIMHLRIVAITITKTIAFPSEAHGLLIQCQMFWDKLEMQELIITIIAKKNRMESESKTHKEQTNLPKNRTKRKSRRGTKKILVSTLKYLHKSQVKK